MRPHHRPKPAMQKLCIHEEAHSHTVATYRPATAKHTWRSRLSMLHEHISCWPRARTATPQKPFIWYIDCCTWRPHAHTSGMCMKMWYHTTSLVDSEGGIAAAQVHTVTRHPTSSPRPHLQQNNICHRTECTMHTAGHRTQTTAHTGHIGAGCCSGADRATPSPPGRVGSTHPLPVTTTTHTPVSLARLLLSRCRHQLWFAWRRPSTADPLPCPVAHDCPAGRALASRGAHEAPPHRSGAGTLACCTRPHRSDAWRQLLVVFLLVVVVL